jgi:hypothetical protein
MSLGGLLLGFIDIAIAIAILVLVGAGIASVWDIPRNIQWLYLAVVALIALYMLVALWFGIPTIHFVHHSPRLQR